MFRATSSDNCLRDDVESGAEMDQRLMEFEARRIAARRSPPDLHRTLSAAYARLGLKQSPPFGAANARIIAQLSADEALLRLEYHNRHHVQDVIDAVAILLTADPDSLVLLQESEALLTAALGHDLHHDGRAFLPEPELERRSARSATNIARDCGVPESALLLIETLIIGTYPALQMELRTKSHSWSPADDVTRLKLILGEADVLASLTPRLGQTLSLSLAKEWASADMGGSPPPSSTQGRRQFLRAYHGLSCQAERLGVGVMIAEQLSAITDDSA